MKRWFHGIQYQCKNCEDRVRLTEILTHRLMLLDGSVECPNCHEGGERLKFIMKAFGLTS